MPQRDYFTQKYRPLAYLVAVAVQEGKGQALAKRVRDLNGESPAAESELFYPDILKLYATALCAVDYVVFLDWFLQDSVAAVASKQRITSHLDELKHLRYARWHVYCPDGRVPVEQSM